MACKYGWNWYQLQSSLHPSFKGPDQRVAHRGHVHASGQPRDRRRPRPPTDKLLVDLGSACGEYQNAARSNLDPTQVECDEIWSFTDAKQGNVPEEVQDTPVYGDCWTWTAIDADTKLIPSWLAGDRAIQDCYAFIADLRSRIKREHRAQLTTDRLGLYPPVVEPLLLDHVD